MKTIPQIDELHLFGSLKIASVVIRNGKIYIRDKVMAISSQNGQPTQVKRCVKLLELEILHLHMVLYIFFVPK